MSGHIDLFSEMAPLSLNESKPLLVDKCTPTFPRGKGTVKILVKINSNWEPVSFSDVFYVPGASNMISEAQMAKKNYTVDLSKELLRSSTLNISLKQREGYVLLKSRIFDDDTRALKIDEFLKPNECVLLWHLKLGHLNPEYLALAHGGGLIKNEDVLSELLCQSCAVTPKSLNNKRGELKNKMCIGEVVMIYITNEARMATEKPYLCVLLQDRATNFCWGFAAKDAEQATSQVKDFIANFEIILKTKVRMLEFVSNTEYNVLEKIKRACKKLNVFTHTASYDPLGNWKLPFTFYEIMQRLPAIFEMTSLPASMSDQVIKTSVFIQNGTFNDESVDMTPYERLWNNKLSFDNLRMLGCEAVLLPIIKNPKGKFVLVGYGSDGTYIFYNKTQGKLSYSKRAKFFEENHLLKYRRNKTNINTPLIPEQADSRPSAPPAELVTHSSKSNCISSDIKAKNLKHLLLDLEALEPSNPEALKHFLEPFKNMLIKFEEEIQATSLYIKTQGYPRSDSLDNLVCNAKREFDVLDTKKDGNCLYHAITLALFGNQTSHRQLRLLLLRHVLEHWNILNRECSAIFDKKLSEIVSRITNQTAWATEAHIFMLSEVLSRPIYVMEVHSSLQIENRIYNSDPANLAKSSIYILLMNKHFEAMVPKNPNFVGSITNGSVTNMHMHVTHKYKYNGNLHMVAPYQKHETATHLYPDLSKEILDQEKLTPPLYELTDNDDDDAEKLFSCLNCKKNNQRLKEIYSSNATMRKQIRQLTSAKSHAENLPIVKCNPCVDLASKANLLEHQKAELKEQHNRYGENLVQRIRSLEDNLENYKRKTVDLTDGHKLLKDALLKKNAYTSQLEREIVALAKELERFRDFDHYRNELLDYWTINPSILSPIMTPGRDGDRNTDMFTLVNSSTNNVQPSLYNDSSNPAILASGNVNPVNTNVNASAVSGIYGTQHTDNRSSSGSTCSSKSNSSSSSRSSSNSMVSKLSAKSRLRSREIIPNTASPDLAMAINSMLEIIDEQVS